MNLEFRNKNKIPKNKQTAIVYKKYQRNNNSNFIQSNSFPFGGRLGRGYK